MKAVTLTGVNLKNRLAIAILAATAITVTLLVPDGTTIADISFKHGVASPTSSTVSSPPSSQTSVPVNSTATAPRSTTN